MDTHGQVKDKAANAAEKFADPSGVNRDQLEGAGMEAAGKARRAYGTLKERFSEAADSLSDNYKQAGERISESWERVEEIVQENPGTTIGVSLLVGAALGSLITYLSLRD